MGVLVWGFLLYQSHLRHPSEPSHSHDSGQLSHPSYLMVIPVNQGTKKVIFTAFQLGKF